MALIMVMGMSSSVCASEPIEGAGDTPVLFAEGLYEGEELEVVAETLGCDMSQRMDMFCKASLFF